MNNKNIAIVVDENKLLTKQSAFSPLDMTKLFNGKKIITASCGSDHTAVIVENLSGNNSLYTFGKNNSINLINYDLPQKVSIAGNPISVSCGVDHTAVIVKNDTGNNTLYTFKISGIR